MRNATRSMDDHPSAVEVIGCRPRASPVDRDDDPEPTTTSAARHEHEEDRRLAGNVI